MNNNKEIKCGLVMPISQIAGYTSEHWQDVKEIIQLSCDKLDCNVKLDMVCDSNQIEVIQKRIIQNVYLADIIICDVSSKNPNVMFELGMSLAFNKPTIIIKDDATDISFDVNIIHHIEYPRDLRYQKIEIFKDNLFLKIQSIIKEIDNNTYEPFLQNFGEIKVAKLNKVEESTDNILMDEINELKRLINKSLNQARNNVRKKNISNYDNDKNTIYIEDINLPANLYNYIKRRGINTTDDLINFYPRLKRKVFRDIILFLEELTNNELISNIE